ncbi:uncharacterized protein [Aegilops tauschii subsp. strangulata]|uniref:uncharacterized protein n=1 Tax=Aegilops tauschii subsp. strangulata TaxID=200361 RepID=UPI003CC86E35
MELTPCEKFLLSDSSDSDDSDVETMLATFRQQTLVMALAVKEHEDEYPKRRRGSTVGRLCIPRNRHLGKEMLMQDYFSENPTYPAHLFRRRYRMRRSLFVKIVEACEANCRYFTQKRNAAGLKGFSAYQKISAAMRVIAYGVLDDYADEYLRIGEDSTIESVRRFAKVIVLVFGPEYLQAPNEDDTKKLMAANERREFEAFALNGHHCPIWAMDIMITLVSRGIMYAIPDSPLQFLGYNEPQGQRFESYFNLQSDITSCRDPMSTENVMVEYASTNMFGDYE